MHVAFVSFEYAGSANGGGIGTYVRNAARMLAARGHDVEVFCADGSCQPSRDEAGIRVETVAASRSEFSDAIRTVFANRQRLRPFDVVEGPEYGADAAGVRRDWPGLPLIVRLHTPSSVINAINHSYIGFGSKLRFMIGALRRGQWPKPYWHKADVENDPERLHALDADLIVAPSQAILDRLKAEWNLPASRSIVVPNIFTPSAELLALAPAARSNSVLFIAKPEVRKGVIELAHAIPEVVRALPGARFVMVGRSFPRPGDGRPVEQVMREAYGDAAGHVEHIGSVHYDQIPQLFSKASVAVFPSFWESFGYVALEAMAAGCAIVASSSGGMAEMIDHGRTGLLVPPRDPKAIAEALLQLLRDPARAQAMGHAARAHVVVTYGTDRIGPLHEASLTRAVELAQIRRRSAFP